MGSQSQSEQLNRHEPWLDELGYPLCEEEIKEAAKEWPPEIWEAYLEWYESPRSESLVHPKLYDKLTGELEESIFENAQTSCEGPVQEQINLALKNLNPRHQYIIKRVFWEGISERKIAYELRINQASVNRTKKRALRKLSQELKKVIASRIMGGAINPLSMKTGVIDDKKGMETALRLVPKAS